MPLGTGCSHRRSPTGWRICLFFTLFYFDSKEECLEYMEYTNVSSGYYRRLRDYFPAHEMKDRKQLEALIANVPEYKIWETDDVLVLYGEFESFLFIDYLLVTGQKRGRGLGSEILRQLKRKRKPILLEVEPASANDLDSQRRRRFYARNGFVPLDAITYKRKDEAGRYFVMDVFCWSPSGQINDEHALVMMKTACRKVHNYKAKEIYGRLPADPDKVLTLN
jgi:GNAT superfamily N-acetyltransferase